MTDAQTFSVAALAAPHPLAAAAGRDVLIEGGNVIEAALAAAAVAAVVAPHRNGLGGDALWLVREAGPRGRVRVLDARGLTGRKARAERLRSLGHDTIPHHGPEAVLCVPGTVAGWVEAHALAMSLGGRLPVSRLLAPAITAARDGFEPLPVDREALAKAAPLADLPGFAASYLVDQKPPEPDARWRFPKLAETLEYLTRAGLEDVYRGDVGRELASDLEPSLCALTRPDLRDCAARWRPPATLDLGRETIEVAPLEAAVTASVALGLIAGLGLRRASELEAMHGLIESLKLASVTVAAASADPSGIEALLDRDVLKRLAEQIDRGRAARHDSSPPPFDEDAVFIGAVDRDGAAVALVQTLGGAWGSGVVSERTGILLGNRGAALSLDPDAGSVLTPGRRVPLLSTALLLSDRDGRVASLGATGPHGGSLVVEVAAHLSAGASAETALAAPRMANGSGPDGSPIVLVEAEREVEAARKLHSAGHTLWPGPSAPLRTLGLAIRLPSGRVEAGSDGGEGAVAGL